MILSLILLVIGLYVLINLGILVIYFYVAATKGDKVISILSK